MVKNSEWSILLNRNSLKYDFWSLVKVTQNWSCAVFLIGDNYKLVVLSPENTPKFHIKRLLLFPLLVSLNPVVPLPLILYNSPIYSLRKIPFLDTLWVSTTLISTLSTAMYQAYKGTPQQIQPYKKSNTKSITINVRVQVEK